MPPEIRIPRAKQVARWFVGIPRSTAEYLLRRRQFARQVTELTSTADFPDEDRAIPGNASTLTHPSSGSGPAFHRTYRIDVMDATKSPEQVIRMIGEDPNRVSPTHVARFEKLRGEPGQLRIGDEFDIELAGPWNGPVRVIAIGERSFRFGTLEGHIEAGEIEFRCDQGTQPGELVVTIESWARSSDSVIGFLYDRIGIAREIQMNMWAHFLERTAQLAGGRVDGPIEVHTERGAETEAAP